MEAPGQLPSLPRPLNPALPVQSKQETSCGFSVNCIDFWRASALGTVCWHCRFVRVPSRTAGRKWWIWCSCCRHPVVSAPAAGRTWSISSQRSSAHSTLTTDWLASDCSSSFTVVITLIVLVGLDQRLVIDTCLFSHLLRQSQERHHDTRPKYKARFCFVFNLWCDWLVGGGVAR